MLIINVDVDVVGGLMLIHHVDVDGVDADVDFVVDLMLLYVSLPDPLHLFR